MKKNLYFLISFFFFVTFSSGQTSSQSKDGSVRIVQLLRQENSIRRYPDALPSLLKMMNEQTNAHFDTDPLYINSFTDVRLLENPILYINCDEQPNLEFPKEEQDALRQYMEQGGFVYLDAGIKASFLGQILDIVMPLGRNVQKLRSFLIKSFQRKLSFHLPAIMIYSEPFFVVCRRMKI